MYDVNPFNGAGHIRQKSMDHKCRSIHRSLHGCSAAAALIATCYMTNFNSIASMISCNKVFLRVDLVSYF